ncbi:hypothetical protein VNI00_015555 [Paramarasmius palmivorus]|uniref:Uncharacterized protein n=1 Tax=Paramarasmius palmivorus TaxID=297713 RepID=A0AAW0BKC6_9AGAR
MSRPPQQSTCSFGEEEIQILRFPDFDLEESLRSENERELQFKNASAFPDEILDLDYEVVEEASVPHVRDFLESRGHDQRSSSASCSGNPASISRQSSSPRPNTSKRNTNIPIKPHSPALPTVSTTTLKSPKKLTARQLRSQRKTELSRARRKKAAQDRDAQNDIDSYVLQTAQSAIPHSIDFNALSMPASEPGWIGTKELPKSELPPVSNLRNFHWDGKVTVVLLDRLDRIWTVLGAPPPKAKDWDEVNSSLMEALEDYDKNSEFNDEDMSNRRSGGSIIGNKYAVRNTGVSQGGGQKQPGNIAVRSLKNKAAIETLSKNECLGRLVGHTSRLYSTFANKLAAESRRICQELQEKDPALSYPSQSSHSTSYWAARSYNTAGRSKVAAAASVRHTDFGNWAPGWCCVTAIGEFDPDQGGQLILWNVGLRIRFPPGCSILFPSAVITHSNEPIRPGEKRYSIVEYSAGGLFRWVYNGFQTDEDLLKGLKGKELERWKTERSCRWKSNVRMYTKWQELLRGDYKGEELGNESDLTDYEYCKTEEVESDLTDYEYLTDEPPARKRAKL